MYYVGNEKVDMAELAAMMDAGAIKDGGLSGTAAFCGGRQVCRMGFSSLHGMSCEAIRRVVTEWRERRVSEAAHVG